MGGLIGSYIAFIIMELIVALPTYYLLRVIFKRKRIQTITLIACLAALCTGWVAGYRFTKDVMVSEYLETSKQNEISKYGINLTQDKWSKLRHDFTTNPEVTQNIHIGAAKVALPSTVIVAILLFWLAGRKKKNGTKNNENT